MNNQPDNKPRSIRLLYTLTIIVVAGLIFLNFEVNFFWLKSFANRLHSQAINNEKVQAKHLADLIKQTNDREISKLEDLAVSLRIDQDDHRKNTLLIESFLKNNPNIRTISLISSAGQEEHRFSRTEAVLPEYLMDHSSLIDFRLSLDSASTIASNIFFTEYGEPYMFIYAPVINPADRQPISILKGQYYLRSLWDIVRNSKIGETGRVFVVDNKGWLIAHPDPSQTLRKVNLHDVPSVKALAGDHNASWHYDNEAGRQVMGVSLPIQVKNLEWGIVAEQDMSEVNTAYDEANRWLKIMSVGNLVIVLILVIFAISLRNSNKRLSTAYDRLEEEKTRAVNEQNRTSAIVRNFTDPLIMVDNQFKICIFNPPAGEIFGLTSADIGRQLDTKNKHRLSLDNFRSIFKQAFVSRIVRKEKDDISLDEEMTVNSQGGQTSETNIFNSSSARYAKDSLSYKVFTAQVCDETGTCHGFIKFFYDITREKEIDKLKSEFISIAAHQLRTPLSSIKWAIKMVLDGDTGPITPDQSNLLLKGYQSNERVIQLVNDLLQTTRIEEGRFGFELKDENITSILKEILKTTKERADKNHITLKTKFTGETINIKADAEKISLALKHILGNALLYTPESGLVAVETAVRGKQFIIQVRDTGMGIPTADIDRLFTKFFRGSNVVRIQTEGNGLGLFIAKNIIEAHGGKIRIKSKEGEGTEVEIILPISS